jgi:hypothetical protein
MRGVGHCECGISSDVACGAVKDRALGYVSLSNRPIQTTWWGWGRQAE